MSLSIGGPFDVGDEVEITANFTDLAGAPADPTTIAVQIKPPTGDDTDVAELDEGDGSSTVTGTWVWTYTIADNWPGTWAVRVRGTAGLLVAEEGRFVVRRSAFTTP